jgi:RimJ/RimL family protein N-acetyltransferase
MHRAYLNTIDYEGESLEQSAAEIAKTVQGVYEALMPHVSHVAVREGALVSATLITRFEGRPFVAFAFTEPTLSGRGLARACLQAAMAALFRQGERELRLVVTLANTPAVALYTRLGFEREEPTRPSPAPAPAPAPDGSGADATARQRARKSSMRSATRP